MLLGQIFELEPRCTHRDTERFGFIGELEASGKVISLEKAIQLIRLHASQDGACCVSKFGANSFKEAFDIIA